MRSGQLEFTCSFLTAWAALEPIWVLDAWLAIACDIDRTPRWPRARKGEA